jgi:peptidoglycan/xylan/chitin deacetylase (PgdA/CDA1 family)
MTFFTRKKMLFAVLGTMIIVGGASFFFIQTHTSIRIVGTNFKNSEVRYAEISPESLATSTVAIGVPILVYHIVRPSYPTDDQAVKGLAQTPEVFEAEMKYLAESGYHVIPFSALEDHISKNTLLPAKPIVISFDDGWGDQFKYAFPILEKYHYTATFFVFTNPIGTRGFMTWDDLRALRDAGMTIGSHTRSHPFLLKITDPVILWNEIDGSKKTLEKNLGITVNEFAYPFGRYNATTTAIVKKAGYRSARGDYVRKDSTQSIDKLFELSALNAPTSIALFVRKFPAK